MGSQNPNLNHLLGPRSKRSKSCYIQVLEEVKIPERQMPKEIKIAQEVPSVMVDNSELQLAARRTREPPKNASQIYCDHPDCRNHIPYFKRRMGSYGKGFKTGRDENEAETVLESRAPIASDGLNPKPRHPVAQDITSACLPSLVLQTGVTEIVISGGRVFLIDASCPLAHCLVCALRRRGKRYTAGIRRWAPIATDSLGFISRQGMAPAANQGEPASQHVLQPIDEAIACLFSTCFQTPRSSISIFGPG
ncbi:hypothetical protein I7I51_06453 [Histoplasma capsulatum]|uniref:Uncharacterized protein n=1 Tax=Ajellomyces capsulatus TaxID=5037 RepID=A0A8A1MNG0_AJECA|nr:hypothetical protein I7I51_06453 [Histoplasma capsulatum]